MNDARQRPLQFRLRSLLVITAVWAGLFGLLQWLRLPPRTSLIVLAILVVSVVAAVGLIVVIASSIRG